MTEDVLADAAGQPGAPVASGSDNGPTPLPAVGRHRHRGDSATSPGSARRVASWVWVALPLLFALPAPICFGWAAVRLRSRALALEAVAYLALCVVWVAMENQPGSASGAGSALAVAAAVVACVRAWMIRDRVFFRYAVAAATPTGPASSSAPAVPAQRWTPHFPAEAMPARDPNNPATWVTPVACTGRDRHPLSISVRHAAVSGVVGALLVSLDAYLHIYGRGLGVGIGLLLAPLLAVLFARWVDGPVLYYRTWGTLHRLRLDTVTAVTAGKPAPGAAAVQLAAPGLKKPLRVSLYSRGYVMPPAARDHLRGWLSGPQVQWSPAAVALFDGHTSPSTAPARRRMRILRVVVGVVLPLLLAAAGVALAWHRHAELAISGAPGYSRFDGPHGKPLAVGRPWGEPCQPVRFTVEEHVPDPVYSQVAAVIAEARHDGLDVTLETRNFRWTPSSLYYPAGRTPASVPRVPIFWRTGPPPTLSGGGAEHIGLGWDAQLDPDGQHEDLTGAQGDLWAQTNSQPQQVRRSVRQLVAMTQGIMRTTRHDSGIAVNTDNDRFSSSDVAAMKLMSGCGQAAAPVVTGAP